jgi:hypothetical protein
MLIPWQRKESVRPIRRQLERPRLIPIVEQLENRVLPAWTAVGPAPQLNGALDLAGNNNYSQPVTGRINALAVGQDDAGHPALFLGKASGGLWRSIDFVTNGTANNNPTWTPLMDFAGLRGAPDGHGDILPARRVG